MKTTIREATRDDTLRLDAFLKKRWETSMFLRSNLRDFGFNSDADYAMRYFLREKGGGIRGVAAVSNSGMLMMQDTEGLTEIVAYMRGALPADKKYHGLLGETSQVSIMRQAFDLSDRKADFDDDEPLFRLDLDALTVPNIKGAALREPKPKDIPTLNEWAYNYMVETGLRAASDTSRDYAKEDAKRRMNSGKLRVLTIDGIPAAQTAFNATLPDAVQIGGVYTPPENRRKGYGRLAVALHLDEARKIGVKHAVLFSANEHASKAYRSIGFTEVGRFTITLFA